MKISHILISIIILLTLNTCKTEVLCSDYEKESGLIIKRVDLGKCFYILNDTTYVIQTRSQFNAIQTEIDPEYKKLYGVTCDTLSMDNLIDIDFSTQTLIGLLAKGTGCSVSFDKNVTKNDQEKSYTYQITTYECGNCALVRSDMNWVVTSKIPDDYTVKFKVIKNVK